MAIGVDLKRRYMQKLLEIITFVTGKQNSSMNEFNFMMINIHSICGLDTPEGYPI